MISKKTIVKKETVKAPAKKIAKKSAENSKDSDLFYVTIKANGEVYEAVNYDIEKALLEACPRLIKTNMTVIVEKNGKSAENFLLLLKAKLLFRSRLGTYIFANRLIFK